MLCIMGNYRFYQNWAAYREHRWKLYFTLNKIILSIFFLFNGGWLDCTNQKIVVYLQAIKLIIIIFLI